MRYRNKLFIIIIILLVKATSGIEMLITWNTEILNHLRSLYFKGSLHLCRICNLHHIQETTFGLDTERAWKVPIILSLYRALYYLLNYHSRS